MNEYESEDASILNRKPLSEFRKKKPSCELDRSWAHVLQWMLDRLAASWRSILPRFSSISIAYGLCQYHEIFLLTIIFGTILQ